VPPPSGSGLDEDLDERTIERHRNAIHTLSDWLSAPRSNVATLILAGLLAAGGGFAVLNGDLSGDYTGPDRLTLAGGALLILAVVMPWLIGRLTARNRRHRAEGQLAAQRIAAPSSWTREAVRQRIEELEQAVEGLRASLQRRERLDELAGELAAVNAKIQALERHRRELAERIGFDPALTTRAMAQFLRDLEVFHAARLGQRQAVERLERLQSEHRRLLDDIRAFLAPRLDELPGDTANAPAVWANSVGCTSVRSNHP